MPDNKNSVVLKSYLEHQLCFGSQVYAMQSLSQFMG
jgi:hypothetical protein